MANVGVQVWDQTNGESAAQMNMPVADGISIANAQALIGAVNAASIGAFGRQDIVTRELVAAGTAVRPTDPAAQKENRFKVTYQDTVTLKYYSFTIPCADLTLLPSGSEFLDLTAGVGLGIVTNYETYGESELGNPVTVISIQFVTL